MNITQVDFKRPPRQSYQFRESGVYEDPRTGAFYERPKINGRRTWRKLAATTLRFAKLEVGKNRSEQALARRGLAKDPYARSHSETVSYLAEFYLESGCPLRNEQPRTGKQLSDERSRVEWIKKFFGKKSWHEVTIEDCRDYHAWRRARVKRGRGDRVVDLELVALSSLYRWALRNSRRTGVTSNPIAHDRMRFCRAETIRHCRDVQPESGDELHRLARRLFEHRQSEAVGWQLLFEAMIGQRTSEILKLRMDATGKLDAGFVQGDHLWLHRSTTHKGTYPYAQIHAALRQCLEAHAAWHRTRYPDGKSPWYFPSPMNPGVAVLPGALTQALRRVTRELGLPARTSHGLRSFFVNVLRSQGKLDAEIALRIGHKSGGRLIVDVYGEILPGKLSWMPETEPPAWARWTSEPVPDVTQANLPLA